MSPLYNGVGLRVDHMQGKPSQVLGNTAIKSLPVAALGLVVCNQLPVVKGCR